jgi:anti-anti-sigma factor
VSTPADVTVERRGDVVLSRLGGDVDMSNAGFVREQLTGAVPNDVQALVLDLGGVRYLDSAAIELLFELARRLDRRRQQLRLVVPGDSPLRRLLALTEVGSVAPLHTTLERAVEQD